jgi:hypothetical protein
MFELRGSFFGIKTNAQCNFLRWENAFKIMAKDGELRREQIVLLFINGTIV